MASYVISYFGEPSFASPEEGAQYQQKWLAWANNLGDALTTPAMPLGAPQIVKSTGVTAGERSGLTGYSIVQADSMAAAVAMAQACPHLEHGFFEVAELMDMGM